MGWFPANRKVGAKENRHTKRRPFSRGTDGSNPCSLQEGVYREPIVGAQIHLSIVGRLACPRSEGKIEPALARNRRFESSSLEQRVCELSVPGRRTDRREKHRQPLCLGQFPALRAPTRAAECRITAGTRRTTRRLPGCAARSARWYDVTGEQSEQPGK